MKSRRHFAIMDILSSRRIGTQEDLCESLKARGYNVTQATVSRDIKELCLIKVPDDGGYHYALPDAHNPRSTGERMRRVFQDSVVNYNFSENIIVLKTLPGAAQAIGSLIDSLDNSHILGNVAGDDTIFVVVKPKNAVEEVMAVFKEMLTE